MIALVDCNSFFCSVERVFHPGLRGKPVCVLSSNDGCIVALTPEAKAVGLKRGDPLFKVKTLVEQHDVKVFSGNLQLYAAMSRRIVNILRATFAHVENYSIDESFCYLDGYDRVYNLTELMRDTVKKVALWTDIPVSVGLAPSKTLAKMGSLFAKKHAGYGGVCAIDNDSKRRKALALTPLADVWGIGRKTLARLQLAGIHTPLELADLPEAQVRKLLTKPGIQTWHELNGRPCIDTTEISRNQSICVSRSFGQMVTTLPHLQAAVTHFSSSCANKLRAQHAVASAVRVYLCSNRFREDLPQYAAHEVHYFQVATSDTLEICAAASQLLQSLFREGIHYKKAGVILENITSAEAVQQVLFDTIHNRAERGDLMKVIDSINQRYGASTIHLSTESGNEAGWKVKSEFRTPNHLTQLDQLLRISD